MKRYVHYHNVGTGVAFWSGEVNFDDGEVTTEGLNQLLQHSSAKLASWDDEQQAGVFLIGPLPGLITLTEGREPPKIDAFKAADLLRSTHEHPVA